MKTKHYYFAFALIASVSALGVVGLSYLNQDSSSTANQNESELVNRLDGLEQSIKRMEAGKVSADSTDDRKINVKLDQLLSKLEELDQRLSVIEEKSSGAGDSNIGLPAAHHREKHKEQHEEEEIAENDESEKLERNKAYLASLDQLILTEGVDQARSIEVSGNLNNVVASKPEWIEGTQLGNTECSQSFCRTQVTFSQALQLHPTAAFELEHSLIMTFANEETRGKMTRTRLADGSQKLTMYLTQNGSEFPPMTEAEATQ